MVSINFEHQPYYVKRETYHKALQRFMEDNKGRRNAEIVFEYMIHKESQNLSVYRLQRILGVMKKLVEFSDFDFDKMEQRDLEKLVGIWKWDLRGHIFRIVFRSYKDHTKANVKEVPWDSQCTLCFL